MGPATTHRTSPNDALRYGIEMLGKGYADVMIMDLAENGKAYAPAEFREFYLSTKGVSAANCSQPPTPKAQPGGDHIAKGSTDLS
jgi:hypothetical protein